jgi:four helix bundle protein
MMKNDTPFKIEFKKRLYQLILKLIEFVNSLPKDNISKRLGDQLVRSGSSVIANYIEGLSGSSKKDFTNYLSMALKSCNESKVWLCLIRDSLKIRTKEIEWLIKEFNEISKILASSIITLKGKHQ